VASNTLEGLVHLGDEPDDPAIRHRRFAYAVMSLFLAAVMVAAVVDLVTPAGIYGVQSRTISAAGADGFTLSVRYPQASRPALASPFDIEVRREGGFDGPVTVAVDSRYLALWDENGLDPAPSEETATDTTTLWTFEPPDGDVMRISFDARIEPGAQNGRDGWVAIVDDASGEELVAVEFHTRVLP
jgi:hypothetical protein